MGDVLAEIRRLVARGGPASQLDQGPMVVTARVTAGTGDERQRNPAQSLALSVELPMSGSAQPLGHRTFPASAASVASSADKRLPLARCRRQVAPSALTPCDVAFDGARQAAAPAPAAGRIG